MQTDTRKGGANTSIFFVNEGHREDRNQAHSTSALTVSVTFEDPHLLHFTKNMALTYHI